MTVALQNYIKMSFKRLYKKLFYLFLNSFSQHFSNRSYRNIKIILAYFYIIEFNTYLNKPATFIFHTFLKLLRVLLAVNMLGSLDFSNESPCLYPKLRITFFNKRSFSLKFFTSFKLRFNLIINQRSEKLFFNHIVTFSSIFGEQKVKTWMTDGTA